MVVLFYQLFLYAVVLGVPIGLWGLYQALARKGRPRLGVLLPSLLLLALAYPAYTALYPTNDFYQAEFTRVTRQPFPASAVVEQRDATFPDQHGAYTAFTRFTVSPADFRRLQQQLGQDSAFAARGRAGYTYLDFAGSTSRLSPGPSDTIYQQAFSGGYSAYGFVGFLRDGRTIVLYRHRS